MAVAGEVPYKLTSVMMLKGFYPLEFKIPRLRLRTLIGKSFTKYLAFLALRAISKMSQIWSRQMPTKTKA